MREKPSGRAILGQPPDLKVQPGEIPSACQETIADLVAMRDQVQLIPGATDPEVVKYGVVESGALKRVIFRDETRPGIGQAQGPRYAWPGRRIRTGMTAGYVNARRGHQDARRRGDLDPFLAASPSTGRPPHPALWPGLGGEEAY